MDKSFEAKGTQSVAAFFSVGKINGMIIAVKAVSESVEAATIYDDARLSRSRAEA